MLALVRLVLFVVVAVVALSLAIVIAKLLFVVVAFAAVVIAGIYLYHFARSLFRRLSASADPRMLTR